MDDFALPEPPPLRYRSHEPVLTSTWTRVDHFSPTLDQQQENDDDDEWEEEEVEYVTLDFGSHLSGQHLAQSDSMQLLAAESSTPIARIGNLYFQGTHETSIGTDILLKPGEDTESEIPLLEPFATAAHRIVFQPVTIDYAQHASTAQPAGSTNGVGGEGGSSTPGRGRGRGRGRGGGRGSTRGAKVVVQPRKEAVTGGEDAPEEGPAKESGSGPSKQPENTARDPGEAEQQEQRASEGGKETENVDMQEDN